MHQMVPTNTLDKTETIGSDLGSSCYYFIILLRIEIL